MKRLKLITMLLALLVAAMVMVPMVSAADDNRVAVDVSKFSTPQLNIDNSQEIVNINAELSPVKGDNVYTIPEGSIIDHSEEGITRVFDSFGRQIIVMDDARSSMVSTPNGMKPSTHVHEVPSGSMITFDGERTTYVTNGNRLLLTVIDNSQKKTPVPGLPDHWIESAQMASQQNIGRFSANWNVPSEPPTEGSQVIYLFNSLRNSEKIIQPVLTWGRDSVQSWRGAGWAVSSSDEYHSTLINVNVGDTITGLMSYNSGAWSITFSDTTTGGATALGISGYLPNTNIYPDVVLECYNTLGDAKLPGTTTFSSFVLQNPSGSSITKSVTADYRDYWINLYGLTKSTSGLNVISSYPYNSVTLHTANP
ncbi:hypothetical protein [Methanoregula sp.]|uniref:hypothetical protein n=1 Tax=Methanoregula sp. TaxID=2052170 RepID=UPI00236B9096|nr:hypothetical protein [Methanoregula sp.]MDD1687224.1 hypothetical protein [Methanoregula sp.]